MISSYHGQALISVILGLVQEIHHLLKKEKERARQSEAQK